METTDLCSTSSSGIVDGNRTSDTSLLAVYTSDIFYQVSTYPVQEHDVAIDSIQSTCMFAENQKPSRPCRTKRDNDRLELVCILRFASLRVLLPDRLYPW